MTLTFLWYIPNTVEPGHRGDESVESYSPDDVTAALRRYAELGIRHFVLSDTPYKRETVRVGDALIGRLREPVRRRPVPAAVGR